ncbi:hypothetical protein ACEPPN_015280 [Leptodophora sp. 'Broadleaf-Isolate-01']
MAWIKTEANTTLHFKYCPCTICQKSEPVACKPTHQATTTTTTTTTSNHHIAYISDPALSLASDIRLKINERSLFKLEITFVKASQDSSLSRPPPKVSPGTTVSEYDDPGLDGGLDGPPPNNCTSTPDDSSIDLPFPLSLDSRFSRVSYVSDKIADSLGPPCGFRDLDFAYPSWASSGVMSAKHNKDYLVMITCHTGEPGADEVLRSELESCIVTANKIKDKRSGNEDSTIEGRVISVTLQSLRILSFRLEPIWLSLTKEEPRLQIFVEACDINASLAWENQDDHIVSPEYLKTFLEKK